MSEIDLTSEQIEMIQNILRQYLPKTAKVWIFGSRVTGKAKPFSDVDLIIDSGQTLSLDLLAKLTNYFEDSLLPYKVDIVDWYSIDEAFRDMIMREGKRI